jgi:hypothetical protein
MQAHESLLTHAWTSSWTCQYEGSVVAESDLFPGNTCTYVLLGTSWCGWPRAAGVLSACLGPCVLLWACQAVAGQDQDHVAGALKWYLALYHLIHESC